MGSLESKVVLRDVFTTGPKRLNGEVGMVLRNLNRAIRRHRLLARNRIVQRRVSSILPTYTYVGMFWSSYGPLSHGTGFDPQVPIWLRTKIVHHGKKAWSLWPNGGFLDDLGDLLLGTQFIEKKGSSYLLVFGIRDRDDFTDFEAKVYRKRTGGGRALR